MFLVFSNAINAQSYYGAQAQEYIKNAKEIHLNKSQKIDYIEFNDNYHLSISNLKTWIGKQFQLTENVELVEINRFTDNLKQTHIRYKLSIDKAKVHDAMIIVHLNNDRVISINGIVQTEALGNYTAGINESTALNYALNRINAKVYKWQIPVEEEYLKKLNNDTEASYFPKAEMEIIRNKNTNKYRLAYKFNIYAHEPMSRSEVFVDANNGGILFINDVIHEADSIGTASTKYSGTQSIVSDFYNNYFRLRESSRGQGIETYDLNNSTNYGSAVDFIDSNNIWNNVNAQQDEVATDAHWGLEMTYDYYYNKHNRNSIDGNGFKLQAYVHYSSNYANAYWNGQVMTFGDGNSSMGPLVALDIVGHEITHGLTSYTADLDYQDESGAMNEAFSDIFGTSIEFYAKPNTANWLMGEDIGIALRSMSNPKAKGDPDTYLGQNYYIGTADNGGVHTNSGILNYYYYLLAAGGSGTNDNGDTYSVNGLGIDTASNIAFRALTVYLTNTSQFADARFYFIKSAIDLYGACSPQVESTTNAFYAIGVGAAYQAGVQADFTSSITSFCAPPAITDFQNLSNNGSSFYWDFGDGDTSSIFNPQHTYSNYGSYTVKLIADGGNCGVDTVIKTEYVSVDTANPCHVYMQSNGTQTLTSCTGVLFDSGGPNNYPDNTNTTTIISPIGATKVTLNFSVFSFEAGYDYLKIYDGPNANSPLIGSYDGNTLPNGGTIVANSGSVTLVQTSDVAVNMEGFVASWQCEYASAPPITSFTADDTASCTGTINFTDLSQNGPTTWSWDFGDGDTSNLRNPSHTYAQAGYYSVSLTATNNFGNNQSTKSNYIHINKPFAPNAIDGAVCNGGSITLSANANGKVNWYNNPNSNTPIDTGYTYTTPNLTSTTSYWVENEIVKPILTGGKAANNSNGGNLAYEQSLIFNVYKNVVLKEVTVYSNASGVRSIKLENSNGNILATRNVNVTSGYNTISLDFNLPIANDLRLVGKDLFRNNSNVNYPYTIPGVLEITKSSANTNPYAYYYYFYDWKVEEPSCKSDKIEIVANVNNAAPSVDFSFNNNDPYVQFNDGTTNPGQNTWSFGDLTTSQQSNPLHTYLQNGTFDVKLIVNNGCGIDSITKSININLATGLNNSKQNSNIKLYPNPNNGLFQIFVGNDNEFNSISIYDGQGRMVYYNSIEKNDDLLNVDIQNFSSGIYFIILRSDNSKVNFRIIKE
jgi:Zn-dependent metalloprotease